MATKVTDNFTILDLLPYFEWDAVAQELRAFPFRTSIRIPKHKVPFPMSRLGFRESLGDYVGQIKDFRLALKDGCGLHVQDFGSHFEAHLDQFDPSFDLYSHLLHDAPPYFALASAVAAGFLAKAFGAKAQDIAAISVGAFVLTGALVVNKEVIRN